MTASGWGYNAQGDTGTGSIASELDTPAAMAGPVELVQANANIGLGVDQHVYWFGNNGQGIAWDGTSDSGTPKHPTPTLASSISGLTFTKVLGGSNATQQAVYALTTTGDLWACGTAGFGEWGTGVTSVTNKTGQIIKSGVIDFACGANHNIVLLAAGVVQTAGRNYKGGLADGTTTDRNTWTTVTPASGTVVGVSAGYAHTLILMADGTVRGVGPNIDGNLGAITGSPVKTWKDVGFSNIVAIATGNQGFSNPDDECQSFGIDNTGILWALGNNGPYAGLGIGVAGLVGDQHPTPVQTILPSGVTAVSLWSGNVTNTPGPLGFIGSDQNLYLWSLCQYGTMANGFCSGGSFTQSTPTLVSGLTGLNWFNTHSGNGWAGFRSATAPTRSRHFAQIFGD